VGFRGASPPASTGDSRAVVPPGQHCWALLASLLAEHGVRHVFDPALVHLEHATPATDRVAGEAAHALFRRPDVYPVLRDFHDVAVTGWYGRPELATPERAEEIAEAVADHVVREAREIWAALGPAGEGR